MKRLFLAAAILLALTGCMREPESISKVGKDFEVAKLFTHDGCAVYRFSDNGRSIYYTNCQGAASSDTSWDESCGKNCTRTVTVPTAKRPD